MSLNNQGLRSEAGETGLKAGLMDDLPDNRTVTRRITESWESIDDTVFNRYHFQVRDLWEEIGKSFTSQFGPEGWES